MSDTQESPREKTRDMLGDVAVSLGTLACLICWMPYYELIIKLSYGFGILCGLIGLGISWSTRKKVAGRSLAGVIISLCAIVGSFFYPTIYTNTGLTRRAASMAYLRDIGLAIDLYEQDFDCRPDNLDELFEVGLDPKLLLSPVSDHRYGYINLPKDAPKGLVWAYDPSTDDGKVFALFHGGNVHGMLQSEFDEIMKQTRDFMTEYPNGQ